MEKNYEFALDKDYESYDVLKQKGYSEIFCREQDLKRQLKKYKEYEKMLGIPIDIFMDILLQQKNIYGIIDGEVEERLVAYISSWTFLHPEARDVFDVRMHDFERSDCGYSTESYNKDFFLTYEEAKQALEALNQ